MSIVKEIASRIDDADESKVVEILTKVVNDALDAEGAGYHFQENDQVKFLKDMTVTTYVLDREVPYEIKKGATGRVVGKAWLNAFQPSIQVCVREPSRKLRSGLGGTSIIVMKRYLQRVS